MTRTLKQRALFTLVVTTLAAALGAAGGYLLGCAFNLRLTQSALDQYASRIRDTIQTFADESYAMMVTANASPYPYCSNAEIASFRNLIFRSKYVRDLGRMRGGEIDCSATMGRLNHPLAVSPPDSFQKDGTKMYRSLPPVQPDVPNNSGVQLGDAYVVFSPFRFSYIGLTPVHYVNTVIDGLSGRTIQVPTMVTNVSQQSLTRESTFEKSGSLYVTRCTAGAHAHACTTAFIPLSEARSFEQGQMAVCTFLGGVIGCFLGLYCSIIYRRSLGMEQQLRRAIRNDELRVVYQPIVELASGRIVEAEALVRWTDEDGFAISPAIFVRIAEERGYVGELTELVVRHALRDFGERLRRHPGFRININVTASDLADTKFLPMLERSLDKAQVAARSLAIEVTESSTASKHVVKETIQQLHERGHSVQIDDFGTGYSSLAYLHDLSVDAIKIDQAFTQAIGTEAVTVGILPQILAMARALNLQVIAEGIETAEQAAYFAGSEMPILGQGWLFGRPVPAEIFLRLLAEAEKKASIAG